jgi:hypothetical protein
MADQHATITEGDVATLKEKLAVFSGTLTPAEQTILGYVLERPRVSGEVEGYTVLPAFTPQVLAAIHASLLGNPISGGTAGALQQFSGRIAGMNTPSG